MQLCRARFQHRHSLLWLLPYHPMRIAILEDDFIVLELLKAAAEKLGHICHGFETGESLLLALRRESFDFLVVDWHLPDAEGPDVVRAVRMVTGPRMPILFATRRQDEADIVEALASGADDFMTKPIRMAEFAARLSALSRRAYPQTESQHLQFGPYEFREQPRNVVINDEVIALTDREYALALCLFQNCGRLLSREHLRELVWNQVHDVPSRTIDTHVSRLRSKLQLIAPAPYTVTAVYGVGYRMESIDAPSGVES